MPAATVATNEVCRYHEQRINKLEDDLRAVSVEQASIDTKVDGLMEQVTEMKAEVSSKLDILLERSSAEATKLTLMETRLGALEKTETGVRSVFRAIAIKAALPVVLVLGGTILGIHGPKLLKLVAMFFVGG